VRLRSASTLPPSARRAAVRAGFQPPLLSEHAEKVAEGPPATMTRESNDRACRYPADKSR